MAHKYTESEILAMEKKMESPQRVVICPRCGAEIGYRSVGNSIEVKCQTKDCLVGTLRGV